MSESINPNTPVMESSPVQVQGGEAPTTFDELDALTKDTKSKKSETKSEKPKESKDLTSDDRKSGGEKKAESKTKDSGKKEEKPDVEAKADQEKQPPKKTFKIKNGDTDTDLLEDALVTVKINGKDEKVPLKDILSNYSGKVAWDKKFSDVENMRRQVSKSELKIQGYAEKIKAIFSEENPDVRMYRMAELAGVSPVQYKKDFLNNALQFVEKFNAMSESERDNYFLQEENKYLKHQSETQSQATKAEQAQRELQAKVDKIRATHQISEDEFESRHAQLVEAAKRNHDIEVTPEFIAETIQKDRLWDVAAERLSALNLEWNDKERSQKLLSMVDTAYKNGLGPQDIPEIIDELWGKSRNQRIVEEKKQQRDEFISGKKPVKSVDRPRDEAVLFDDL